MNLSRDVALGIVIVCAAWSSHAGAQRAQAPATQPNVTLPAPPASPAPPARPAPPALPAPLASQGAKPRLFPPTDLGLLETPDRDDWNKPDLIMDTLGIADGAVVADLGAGGGWFTIHLARRVGPNGTVYAQDIQPEMIEAINRRVQNTGLSNVRTVMGTATDPRLPAGLDVAVIVNAYREMDDPSRPEKILTLFENVRRALKPQGRLGVVDFLPGDGGPGPAAAERVNPDAVIKVAQAAGFQLQSRQIIPPFQMMLVFTASPPPPKRLY